MHFVIPTQSDIVECIQQRDSAERNQIGFWGFMKELSRFYLKDTFKRSEFEMKLLHEICRMWVKEEIRKCTKYVIMEICAFERFSVRLLSNAEKC